MAPETIETTDLEDSTATYVPGVQSLEALEFTANYTAAAYASVKASENTEGNYSLEFGDAGADGIFTWTGQHTVYVNGGDVNSVREMTIVITPSSAITKST